MARTGSSILDTDDLFPELNVQLVSGETAKLPLETWEGYSVILIYRGHW